MEELRELGQKKQGTIHCLSIIGQIEGHQILPDDIKATKYEHIMPMLAAIEESNDIEGLLVLINTAGGDVEAGLAIAELIAGMTKPTASLVLGGGHSIGVPLAVAAKKSFIAQSASMTLHPVRINGLVIGAEQSFDYLSKMQNRITDFVVGHSNIEREKYIGLISATGELSNDIGSIISGAQAVDLGLIDEVGDISKALKYLHSFENMEQTERY